MELPTGVQTVSGLILLSVRACLSGYANEVVLVNRVDFEEIVIFEVGGVTVSVGGKELF